MISHPCLDVGTGGIASLKRKRSLFAYPQLTAIERRRTPISEVTIYYLLWQICLGEFDIISEKLGRYSSGREWGDIYLSWFMLQGDDIVRCYKVSGFVTI